MSFNQKTAFSGVQAGARAPFNLKTLGIGASFLLCFVVSLRLYEQFFGWSAGLDSFAPEYQLYWSSLLGAAIAASFLAAFAAPGYLWRTRDRHLDAIQPAEELRRYLVLLQWLVLFALALYFGLSFFTEQTAVWHMTAVRDTDFTPSNIITFYVAYPLYTIAGLTAYFYATTRLPAFSTGYSLPFVILVVGTFMIIPNVGFNEWGHTFWFMDEGFAGPLHWGFVFFGWMTLGAFGVTLQILGRLRELMEVKAVLAPAPRR
jgi:methane/ammonia monooxygenase subunit C